MLDVFSGAIDYLLGQGIQIAAIFAIVWAVCFLLRRRSAHLRYLLWLLVIAKCIFPSVVKVSLAVLPEKEAVVVAAAEVIEQEPPTATASVAFEFENAVYNDGVFAPASFVDRLRDISLMSWGGIVWCGGVVLFFAVVCFKACRLNRKLVAMRKPANISEDMPVKVWQIDGIAQPFVWGLGKGSVYLPADFENCGSVEDRRGILMHEFAHVRRFDAGVNVLQIIAQGLFWFHPLVWIANKMIRQEREKCCDEATIAGLKTVPRDYGKAIIDTLTREYASSMPVGSLAIAGPVKNIEDRIKTIMRPGKKFYGRCGAGAMMIILLLAVVAVPTGLVLTAKAETVEPQQEVNEPVKEEIAVPKKGQGGVGSGGFGGGGVGIDNSTPKEVSRTGNKKLLIKYSLVMADSKDIKKLTADGNVLTDEQMKSFSGRLKTLHSFSALVYDGTKASISTKVFESPDDAGKHPEFGFSGTISPKLVQDGKAVFLDIHLELTKPELDDTGGKAVRASILTLAAIVPDGGTVVVSPGEKFSIIPLAEGKELFLLVKAVVLKDEAEEPKTAISIECRFIEAGSDFLEELGIEVTVHAGDKIPHSKPLLDNETGIINPANSECADTVLFDSLQRNFILSATRSDPQAKILTAPNVTVFDTEAAVISTASEIPYISGYEEDPNNPGEFNKVTEWLENGIKLELTPTLVNNCSDIDLRFNFESKQLIEFTDAVHESGKIFQLPAQMTTKMSSRVIIPNGKTYLTVTHKLPNSSTESSFDRYMIILITPKIIKPAEVE